MAPDENVKNKPNQEDNTKTLSDRFLILHNDEHHSFDYVIDALIDVCEHDTEQAEQCTIITHYKGKCDVKKGSFAYLSPMRKALVEKELKATID